MYMIFLAKGIQDILFWYLQYNFFSFSYCSVFYWMHTCSWYIFGLFDLFRITLSKDITVNLIFHVYFSLNMHMEDLYRFCTKVEKPLHQKLLHIKFIQKYQTFFQGNCPVYVPIRREFPCGIALYAQDWRQSTMIATARIKSGSYQSLAWHFPNG